MNTVLEWLSNVRGILAGVPTPRRYRVAPRQHPILFRRRLMQGIARELRQTGLVVAHRSMPYSDTAL